MRPRIRVAAAAGAVGVLLLLWVPFASGAGADSGPSLAGLSLDGTARGLQVTFGFQDFILGNFVNVASPHAHTELSSLGGGTSRAVASQVYPGDLIAGKASEQFPGYREANYPASPGSTVDKDDDTNTVGPLTRTAGPLDIQTSHLKTHADVDAANALVTTERFALAGSSGPLLEMTSAETTSDADGAGSTIVEQARTTIKNLKLIVTNSLTISIGQIESKARSTSDGNNGDASATFKLSSVQVTMNGTTYGATIDQGGISLNLPSDQIPSQVSDQIPSRIPQSLAHEFSETLDRYGISITTSTPVEIVQGASADATVGGLLISLRGAIPSVYTPDAAKQLLFQVINTAQPVLGRDLCQGRKNPLATKCAPQEICPTLAAPLCVTPQVVPGPGQGFQTSFAIGLAHAAASAATPFQLPPVPPPGGFGGGTTGGTTGGLVGPPVTGPPATTTTTTGGAQPTQPQRPLFGLVARMPSGALLGAGGALLALAIALGLGPSLGPWRPRIRP